MAAEGMSLQRADFVGRDERLTEFGANLRLPPGDPGRKILFNIHGVAGVGKTFLTEQFRRVAERAEVVCAHAAEASFDVLETMSALAAAATSTVPSGSTRWTAGTDTCVARPG